MSFDAMSRSEKREFLRGEKAYLKKPNSRKSRKRKKPSWAHKPKEVEK